MAASKKKTKPVKKPAKKRTPRTDPVKRIAFLAAIGKCGVISHAARLAKISRTSHYEWMEQILGYPALYAEAHEIAADALEQHIRKRAFKGSDVLAMFLMKKLRPEFREHMKVEHSGELNIIIERLNAARLRVAGVSEPLA